MAKTQLADPALSRRLNPSSGRAADRHGLAVRSALRPGAATGEIPEATWGHHTICTKLHAKRPGQECGGNIA
jgi:hypothetical protein